MPQGDTPYILRGSQSDMKRLFYSDPNNALSRAITIPAGYGIIEAGAVMGIITESTSRVDQYVPYTGIDTVGNVAAGIADLFGAAFLVSDPSTGTTGYTTLDDSYKFLVGDHLVCGDSDRAGTETDLGAITAIDRTTYTHMGVITVTNAFESQTIAKGAVITIQSFATAPFVKGVGILVGTVDAGTGEDAKGAQGVMVIKNAMLYKDSLYNYNADVLTDLSGSVENGRYLVM